MIRDDPWWAKEFAPPSLKLLGSKLREHYGIAANAIGMKGNDLHLSGYHRSRAFLLRSSYAAYRSYSTIEPGNQGGHEDWVCGLDISLPDHQLLPTCGRLDDAVQAGRIEKVAEWYGNKDGDTRVDGYNNIANEVATSDSSHLWHLHISILRSRANDNHDDLFNILTGGADLTPEEHNILVNIQGRVGELYAIKGTMQDVQKAAVINAAGSVTRDSASLAAITALSAALRAGTGASIDTSMIISSIEREAEKTRQLLIKQAISALDAASASYGSGK